MAKLQHILCVESSHFKNRTHGFSEYQLKSADIVIAQRDFLETNDAYRQVLPINIFINDRDEIWAYRRTSHGGEDRLHGKIAVAVGGHWDLADVVHKDSIIDADESLLRAVERELGEEVTIYGSFNSEVCTTVICADDTDVDRKHVAIVYIHRMADADESEIVSNELDLDSLGFVSMYELREHVECETWTYKILEMIMAD